MKAAPGGPVTEACKRMHISNFSVASLFSEMQSLFGAASGGSFSLGLGAGQNMPSSSAASSTSTAPTTPPAATTPAGQFASDLLSHLLQSQQSWSQSAAGDIINTVNPGGSTIDLSQVEQAVSGSTSSTTPENMAIATVFSQMTGGTDQMTESQLAQALQTMDSSMNGMGGMGRHHHHHHIWPGGSDASSSTDTASSASDSTVSTPTDATAA